MGKIVRDERYPNALWCFCDNYEPLPTVPYNKGDQSKNLFLTLRSSDGQKVRSWRSCKKKNAK